MARQREIDPFDLPNCPYYLISRVTLCVTSALKRDFAAAGVGSVKPAYLGVLMSLWQQDGIKVVDLARRAGLETSTMTGLLDRMERDNLLSRAADLTDRRAHRIHLTEAGREVKDAVMGVLERTLGSVFEGISDNDLAVTTSVLRQVLANAREGNQ